VAVYARDRGYFKAAGIDPKLIPVQSPGVVAAGLLSVRLVSGTMGIAPLPLRACEGSRCC